MGTHEMVYVSQHYGYMNSGSSSIYIDNEWQKIMEITVTSLATRGPSKPPTHGLFLEASYTYHITYINAIICLESSA